MSDALTCAVGEKRRPLIRRGLGCGVHAEVDRSVVVQHHEDVTPVVHRVLDVFRTCAHDGRSIHRSRGRQQPDLRRGLAGRFDDDPPARLRDVDGHEEPLVGLLVDDGVGGCIGAHDVPHHAPGAHGLVGNHVEEDGIVSGPGGTAPRGPGNRLVAVRTRGDVPEPHGVQLAAVRVARPREHCVIVGDVEDVQCEVLAVAGLDVLVDEQLFAHRGHGPPTCVHGVLETLGRVRAVPPGATAHRDGVVVFLHTRLDLGEQLLDEV